MANHPTLPEAMKILQDALMEDKEQGSYYYSWQSNIAMAFIDATKRFFDADGSYLITQENLHEIANESAKNFLNTLCEPNPKTMFEEMEATGSKIPLMVRTLEGCGWQSYKHHDNWIKKEWILEEMVEEMGLDLHAAYAKCLSENTVEELTKFAQNREQWQNT